MLKVCSYCGGTEKMVKAKNAFPTYKAKTGYDIKQPVCSWCFQKISQSKLHPDKVIDDSRVDSELKSIRKRMAAFTFDSSIADVGNLVSECDHLATYQKVVEADFHAKAEAASLAAARLEAIRSAVEITKTVLEQKVKCTYEHCRKVSSLAIRDPELRKIVFERDGYKCINCGTSHFLSVDHIRPVLFGGDDSLENLQTLCIRCNSSKGASFKDKQGLGVF